jgi:hypothetical protein
MRLSIKSIISRVLVCTAIFAATGCTQHKPPPLTVEDLMEDRVALDGIVMKCNQDPSYARSTNDCITARIAAERLAKRNSAAEEAQHAEAFERNREQLRAQQDKQREEQAAKVKVDAYHLPVMPVEQTPPPKDPQSPVVGQTSP